MTDQERWKRLVFRKADVKKDKTLLLRLECEINYANESRLKERFDFAEYRRRWHAKPRPRKILKAFKEALKDKRTICEFAETAEGDKAAFFLVTFSDLAGFDLVSAFLEDIYVFEKYRRLGIASFILSDIESRTKKAGAHRLSLGTSAFNAAARGLHENNGYRIYRCGYEKELL